MSNATRLMDAAVARMQGDHKPLEALGRSAPTMRDAWEIMREARAEMTTREAASDYWATSQKINSL